MKLSKKGWVYLLGIIIALVIIKNIVPIIAGLVSILLKIAIAAFVILIAAIIVKGVKGGGKAAPAKAPADVKTYGAYTGPKDSKSRALSADERKLLSEANADFIRLKTLSSRIKDSEIKELFQSSVNTIEDITGALKTDPDDIQPAHRVLSYYLPSLRTIMEKYLTLQDSGTDMEESSEKVKEHLKEIGSALKKQYDNLYSNDKLDLTVEMKALSVALKRDGLTDGDIAG